MSIRVLVVEDEELVAAAYAEYVGRIDGFELAGVAHTAAAAARLIAETEVDLILLDMHLPDGHGLGLLRRVRASGHLCDVIAVTSARDATVVRHAVAQGVVLYLIKPFTFASLRGKLERYAAYHAGLTGAETGVEQEEVDRMLGSLRPGSSAPAKGMSNETLHAVLQALREAGQPLSASEVAQIAGISRVTARRYLERLGDQGSLDRTARYGGSGRPELEYRLR